MKYIKVIAEDQRSCFQNKIINGVNLELVSTSKYLNSEIFKCKFFRAFTRFWTFSVEKKFLL